jgi:hypothetical protein
VFLPPSYHKVFCVSLASLGGSSIWDVNLAVLWKGIHEPVHPQNWLLWKQKSFVQTFREAIFLPLCITVTLRSCLTVGEGAWVYSEVQG